MSKNRTQLLKSLFLIYLIWLFILVKIHESFHPVHAALALIRQFESIFIFLIHVFEKPRADHVILTHMIVTADTDAAIPNRGYSFEWVAAVDFAVFSSKSLIGCHMLRITRLSWY